MSDATEQTQKSYADQVEAWAEQTFQSVLAKQGYDQKKIEKLAERAGILTTAKATSVDAFFALCNLLGVGNDTD
jgi:hypothetical protein